MYSAEIGRISPLLIHSLLPLEFFIIFIHLIQFPETKRFSTILRIDEFVPLLRFTPRPHLILVNLLFLFRRLFGFF